MKTVFQPSRGSSQWRRSRLADSFVLFLMFSVHSLFLCVCQATEALAGTSVSSDIVTCDKEGETVLLIVKNPGSVVKFKCGDSVPTLSPARVASDQTFCDSPNCKNPLKLEEEFPGAKLTQGSSGNEYSFTTTQWPKAAGSVYFACKAADVQASALEVHSHQESQASLANKTCIVRIVIWAEPEDEDLPSYECSTPTGQRFFSISYSGDHASFTCGTKMALESETDVYQTAECTNSTPLESLLPSATITKRVTDGGSSANPMYTLTVPQLPDVPVTQLCLVCKDKSSSDKCKVLIGVETLTGEEAHSLIASTEAPSQSGAGSTASQVTLTSVLSIVLVASAVA